MEMIPVLMPPASLLVSEGARTFAERHGVKCLLQESLICPRALEEWRKWKGHLDNYGGDNKPDIQELSRIQDTVGAISWDSFERAAAGVSRYVFSHRPSRTTP